MILAQQKLIWLIALVAFYLVFNKLRSGHVPHRPTAFRMMAYGCGLLIFGATIGLVGNMGLLGAGYSQSVVFFVFESIVGYIGGWSLVIWGAAIWLPNLFSVSDRLERKSKALEFNERLKDISLLAKSTAATFVRVATALMKHSDYQGVSLHVKDLMGRLSLFSAVGLTESSKRSISSIEEGLIAKAYDRAEVLQADDRFRLHPRITLETTDGKVVDALSMPVDIGKDSAGVITVYTNHARVFSQDDLKVLEAVAGHIGSVLFTEGLQRSLNSLKSFKDFIAVVLKTARSEDNLNSQLIKLCKLLRQSMRFDCVHLYLLDDGPSHILDFNLPGGGSVIVQRGYFAAPDQAPVWWVIDNRCNLTIPDDTPLIGGNFKPSKNVTTLYSPVAIGGQPVGVLSVSMKGKYQFSRNDRITMDAIASILSGTILKAVGESETIEAIDRIGAVKYSLEMALNQQHPDDVPGILARIMVEKTPATYCRIMLLNDRVKTFKTSALYQCRQLAWHENTFNDLALSQLSAHEQAMITGKPQLLNRSKHGAGLSQLEACLLFPDGISQCLIIPIVAERKTIGVVSLGESRNLSRNRLDSHQLVYALLLTQIISMSVWQRKSHETRDVYARSGQSTFRRPSYSENQVDSLHLFGNINSRINGPLAGILASCEYIKSKNQINRAELAKYIEVINRNAEKIHKLANKFSETRMIIDKAMKY